MTGKNKMPPINHHLLLFSLLISHLTLTLSLPPICTDKHISKQYFTQHKTLLDDTQFTQYLSQTLNPNPSSSQHSHSPIISKWARSLIGEGSHRKLQTKLTLNFPNNKNNKNTCNVVVIEKLPFGVFADPFELQHQHQHRRPGDNLVKAVYESVAVFGDDNLEMPAFRSNRSVVEVHLSLNNVATKEDEEEDVFEVEVEVPLHVRYPPLEESGYSKVVFGKPDLLYRCKVDESLAAEGCLLTRIVNGGGLEIDPVVWSIPAGIKAHEGVVSVVTFMSAFLSAACIIVASLRHPLMGNEERLKQT